MAKVFIDLFCGGGGASVGVMDAWGDALMVEDLEGIFIDYDPMVLGVHKRNHPEHAHLEKDLFVLEPKALRESEDGAEPVVPHTDEVVLLWASPSCVQFSRARADRPVTEEGRAHGDRVVDWVEEFKPQAFIVENVREFRDWGPVVDGKPDPKRKGEYFADWRKALSDLGYDTDCRVLCSADYGDITIRKRLFILGCRRDSGLVIRWPEITHPKEHWRAADEILDYSDLGKSVIRRPRQLAGKTLLRISRGIVRFWDTPKEQMRYVVILRGTSNVQGTDAPLQAVTAGGKHQMLLTVPFMVNTSHGQCSGAVAPVSEPVRTLTTKSSWGCVQPLAVIAPRETAALELDDAPKYHTSTVLGRMLQEEFIKAGRSEKVMVWTDGTEYFPAVVVEEGLRILDPMFRMISSKEMALAQGFPPYYKWEVTDTQKTKVIGNSVSPGVARAPADSFFMQMRCSD